MNEIIIIVIKLEIEEIIKYRILTILFIDLILIILIKIIVENSIDNHWIYILDEFIKKKNKFIIKIK